MATSTRRLLALNRQLAGTATEASSPGPAGEMKRRTNLVVQEGDTGKVIYDKINFPEGPRWHNGRLYFVDMSKEASPSGKGETGIVCSIGPNGEDPRVEADMKNVTGKSPSGLGWLPDGRLIIVSMGDFKLVQKDANSGQLSQFGDLTKHTTEGKGMMNDMTVSKAGFCYVDLYTRTAGDPPRRPINKIICVPKTGGEGVCVAELPGSPNGLVLTPGDKELIIGLTDSHKYLVFDVNNETGMLSRMREWSDPGMMTPGVPGSGGHAHNFNPDGCCLDAENCIWASSPNLALSPDQPGGPHCRVAQGGQITEIITPPPGKNAIACCLGGDDGKTLFLLEAKYGPGKRVLGDPNTAHIRAIRVAVGAAKDPNDPTYTAGYR